MPGMDGFETVSWLNKNHPQIKIIILSIFDADIALIRLLKEGIAGFLNKDAEPEELLKALRLVYENGYYFSKPISNKMALLFKCNKNGQLNFEKSHLSEAEIKFLDLACSNKTYKEIANELKLSVRIIDHFRENLFVKLGVKSRVELAIFAIRNGITNNWKAALINQLIPHAVHNKSANGFGIYFQLHVLADGFNSTGTKENCFRNFFGGFILGQQF